MFSSIRQVLVRYRVLHAEDVRKLPEYESYIVHSWRERRAYRVTVCHGYLAHDMLVTF
jgi:hypothetical protein